MVTLSREAYDDIKRFLRDREANSQKYTKLTSNGKYKLNIKCYVTDFENTWPPHPIMNDYSIIQQSILNTQSCA